MAEYQKKKDVDHHNIKAMQEYMLIWQHSLRKMTY